MTEFIFCSPLITVHCRIWVIRPICGEAIWPMFPGRGGVYYTAGGGIMNWEEIGRKYENEKRAIPLFERAPALGKRWGKLVRSTDKLVWLLALSGNIKQAPKKRALITKP